MKGRIIPCSRQDFISSRDTIASGRIPRSVSYGVKQIFGAFVELRERLDEWAGLGEHSAKSKSCYPLRAVKYKELDARSTRRARILERILLRLLRKYTTE